MIRRFPRLTALCLLWLSLSTVLAFGATGVDDANDPFSQKLKTASLSEQRQLLHDWAVQDVLPQLGTIASGVSEKFSGVRATGQIILHLDYTQPIDVRRVLYEKSDFWRGRMEMVPQDPLVALMPAFLYLANGEWDRANTVINLVRPIAATATVQGQKMIWASHYLSICLAGVNAEIKRGTTLHDEGHYKEAIAIYRGILGAGIKSALARYELFFSTFMLDPKRLMPAISGHKKDNLWDTAAVEIYAYDPLFTSQFIGERGKTMAALKDRFAIRALNEKPSLSADNKATAYADLALKLEAYPEAAQLYWGLMILKDPPLARDEILARYLYCLDKLGATDIRHYFKDDYSVRIRELDRELTKHRAE